jgi:hypothetical protein
VRLESTHPQRALKRFLLPQRIASFSSPYVEPVAPDPLNVKLKTFLVVKPGPWVFTLNTTLMP